MIFVPGSFIVTDFDYFVADRNGRRPCPLCTKVISNKSNLLKHMRIRHSDVYNPACCLLCNKLFKNKYSLRAHLNIYHKQYISSPGQPQPNNAQPVYNAQPQPVVEPQQQQYLPTAWINLVIVVMMIGAISKLSIFIKNNEICAPSCYFFGYRVIELDFKQLLFWENTKKNNTNEMCNF